MSDEVAPAGTPAPAAGVDPVRLETAIDEIRAEGSMVRASLAGTVAAVASAFIWMGITVATMHQIGWMAVGVGFLVGLAVRIAGKGIDRGYGVLGSVLSLLGCVLGNLLTGCVAVANAKNMTLGEVLSQLTPSLAWKILEVTFDPMDVLFYGIAVYEGFRLSIRRLTPGEIQARLDANMPGAAPGAPPIEG